MIPIVIFYHCCFQIGDKRLDAAESIIREQMTLLKSSGLEDAASEIHIGLNGGKESERFAKGIFPSKALVTYHSLQCRSENRTLLMMENWCRSHKGEAHLLYFHSKGASYPLDSEYAKNKTSPWRNRMMDICVSQWRMCVKLLEKYEAVGCHWLTGKGPDQSQSFFAGNFYWVRASFFRTIPSIMTRHRIKTSGMDALESRYESEVHIGNGPRLPRVKCFFPYDPTL
jgi:hypothetical protein